MTDLYISVIVITFISSFLLIIISCQYTAKLHQDPKVIIPLLSLAVRARAVTIVNFLEKLYNLIALKELFHFC